MEFLLPGDVELREMFVDAACADGGAVNNDRAEREMQITDSRASAGQVLKGHAHEVDVDEESQAANEGQDDDDPVEGALGHALVHPFAEVGTERYKRNQDEVE
jgi:hypothetical protein